MNKILLLFFFFKELHYSTIANFFTIVDFYMSEYVGEVLDFYAKFFLLITYVILNVNALTKGWNEIEVHKWNINKVQ